MRTSLNATLLASSLAGIAFLAPPAVARPHYNDRPIEFTLDSGGYCDSAGCPDRFWRYPVHYGPVFYHGRWFKGPVYYRGDGWDRQFWVQGGWHRDEWRGSRPGWARNSHDGPPLPFDYYRNHNFRMNDRWRHMHDTDDRDGDRRDHGGDWHDRGPDNNGDNRDGRGDDNGGRGDDNGGGRDRNGDNGRGGDNGGRNMDNVLHVTSATYGGQTCHTPTGNVTRFVAQACDGKKMCEYTIQYQAIGDPAPNCAKDFNVQWTCSMGPGGAANVAAEAGLGSKVTLQCENRGH